MKENTARSGAGSCRCRDLLAEREAQRSLPDRGAFQGRCLLVPNPSSGNAQLQVDACVMTT